MIFVSRMGLFHDSPKKNEEKTFTTNNKISLVGKRLAKCLKSNKNWSKLFENYTFRKNLGFCKQN